MTSKFNKIFEEKCELFKEFVKKEYYRDASGKMHVKRKASRPGYRVKVINGKPKEVRMTTKERRNRALAAKKSAIQRYKKSAIKKTKPKKLVKLGS
jgi:hypothetical protein